MPSSVNIQLRPFWTKIQTEVDGLAVFFALGLAVLAFGVAGVVFFVAGAFFVVEAFVEVFFGAAFLVVADVVVEGFGLGSLAALVSLASLGSFYILVSHNIKNDKRFWDDKLWQQRLWPVAWNPFWRA